MHATATMSVSCGNCGGKHSSVNAVRHCYDTADRTEQPLPAQPGFLAHPKRLATEKQIAFARKLIAERDYEPGVDMALYMSIFEECFPKMDTKQMSKLIDTLLSLPMRPQAKLVAPKYNATLPDVPAGHYAVASVTGNNDLDFFRVDRPTTGRWSGYTFVKRVIGGHSDVSIPRNQTGPVLSRIAQDVQGAAVRYGQEIGRCYKCNRHLTDDLSRQLGIGPTCRS